MGGAGQLCRQGPGGKAHVVEAKRGGKCGQPFAGCHRCGLLPLLQQGSGQVRLFYASRDAASLIFAEELAEWSARYPDRLQLRIWLDAEQGVPSGPAIATKIADWSAADAFICGPQPFMDAAGAAPGRAAAPAEAPATNWAAWRP